MKRATLFCGLLAMLGTGAVLWQQHSWSNLRHGQANRFLSEKATNWEVGALQSEIITLREQTRDLPKLRNEVSQLRARRAELVAARAENARLLEVKRTGAMLPREIPPGFIAKEQLQNAGYATPEAAVETFFWAMRESRLDLMLQSLSPNHRDRKNFERLPPETRAQQISGFSAGNLGSPRISNFSDFTVMEREQISDETVLLSLRSSASAKVAKYRLKRLGTEWKIEDMSL